MWWALLLSAALAGLFVAMPASAGLRDQFLRAAVMWGLALWGFTEALSLFGALNRFSLATAWLGAIAAAGWLRYRGRGFRVAKRTATPTYAAALVICAIGGVLAVTGLTAAV